MIRPVIFFFCCVVCTKLSAQDDAEKWFDFWIGEWEVRWQDADGATGSGTNSVIRILDNAVIQENFRALTGALRGYKGTSLSVYNPRTKSWHQGYADNEGAYFNFEGAKEGVRRIFKTAAVQRDGKQIVQRMVFYDIGKDAITWDWELSEDGGRTWLLKWKIDYRRIKQ